MRHGARVTIAPSALDAMEKSRALVEKILHDKTITYGINTGFGDFSRVAIPEEQASLLQNNLILSHCTATANPTPRTWCAACCCCVPTRCAPGIPAYVRHWCKR
jgi:histidine ammonia-lyase